MQTLSGLGLRKTVGINCGKVQSFSINFTESNVIFTRFSMISRNNSLLCAQPEINVIFFEILWSHYWLYSDSWWVFIFKITAWISYGLWLMNYMARKMTKIRLRDLSKRVINTLTFTPGGSPAASANKSNIIASAGNDRSQQQIRSTAMP